MSNLLNIHLESCSTHFQTSKLLSSCLKIKITKVLGFQPVRTRWGWSIITLIHWKIFYRSFEVGPFEINTTTGSIMSNLIRGVFWNKNAVPTRWGRPLPARHFQILVVVHVHHIWVQVENPFAFRCKFGWSKVSPSILFLDKYIFFKLFN